MCCSAPWDFLNNASVGAAVGAIATYIVVRLTDYARNRRKAKSVLPSLVAGAGETAREWLQSMEKQAAATEGMVALNIGAPLDPSAIEQTSREVFAYLSHKQHLAIPKLIFFMKQADALNDREQRAFIESREGREAHAPTMEAYRRDRKFFLETVAKLSDAYVNNTLNARGFFDPTP
jgi:hypothetical protein